VRLTQAKLAGFKSFVDPTSIPVPGQLVAVVGPNGCGKSNVIDAVRWVLGESSARQLRGESMQDVIFNGSDQRKPVSRASVELLFDNSLGRAAGQWSQYAEISIKRVLTRQGESSYYINNIQCRRRDIADLFLGTGVGTRGYAVIVPNFRITPGFGKKIFRDGFGKVGRQMSEDHEDAAKWAIDQGIAAPGRICITGASYGGYATLRALSKTPDLFACGVAGLVVSDLELQLTSQSTDFGGSAEAIRHWRRMIGEKGTGWEQSRAVSPARQLGQITSPLMIWAGRDDVRTPLEQYERVVSGMKALGKTPDVMMVKDGEAHGYRKPENVLDLYEQMVLFLKRHIGTSRTRVTSGELTGQSAP
jgi:acetyl esterase/lipase